MEDEKDVRNDLSVQNPKPGITLGKATFEAALSQNPKKTISKVSKIRQTDGLSSY